MEGITLKTLILVLLFWSVGCSSNLDNQASEFVDLLTAYDFENGPQGWEGGISDYPVDYQESADYQISNFQMPNSLSLDGKSLKISADNPYGDLFYFFKRKIPDLEPNKKYKIDFEFLIYTQLLTQIDKLSSEELYLKIGAVNYEPSLEQLTWRNSLDYMTLNVDKGATNSDSGDDIINIGSISELTSETPEAISGNTFDQVIEVETDMDGNVWLVVGVDSGLKSQLTFGMAALTVFYRKQN